MSFAAGTERPLSRADLRLERSLGKKGNFGKHFAIATGGIAVAGGLLSALTWNECPECWIHPESRPEAFVWGLAAGGLVGLPIGVSAGLAIKVERWTPVVLPGSGSESNAAQSGGKRFGVYAAFGT